MDVTSIIHIAPHNIGALCYADDVTLLAKCYY